MPTDPASYVKVYLFAQVVLYKFKNKSIQTGPMVDLHLVSLSIDTTMSNVIYDTSYKFLPHVRIKKFIIGLKSITI